MSVREKMIERGETPCKSCPHDYPFPATHIAHPKLIDGSTGEDWPLCSMHMPFAMCAGWFPVDEISASNPIAEESER